MDPKTGPYRVGEDRVDGTQPSTQRRFGFTLEAMPIFQKHEGHAGSKATCRTEQEKEDPWTGP